MPRGDKLIEERLKKIIEGAKPKPPVPIVPSRLDKIATQKTLNNKLKKGQSLSRRDLLLIASLGLLGYSSYKLAEGFLNPTSNMQTDENVLKEPEIVNEVFELMSDSEKAVLKTALFDFFNTFGIQEVDIRIIDSLYKNSEFPQEIYASPGELQLDMGLIRVNAAKKGLTIEDYFRLTLLDSLSQVIQDRGDVRLPETTKVHLDEGYLLVGYKGFRVLVDVGGGQVGSFDAVELAFSKAFATAVDSRYPDLMGKKGLDGNDVSSQYREPVRFVELLLAHYGIGIGEALDLNRGHGLDHLLLRMLRDKTLNEEGEVALTIQDVDKIIMYFEEVNAGGSADELFARYVRISTIDEQ